MTTTSRKTIPVILTGATRLPSSVNGNPRFTLHTDSGDFTTSSDAACNYEVTNYTNTRGFPSGRPVLLSLTRAGRVWGIGSL